MRVTMFSIRLKELREDKNLTQYELAKILNISRSSLASYETDAREPDFTMLKLIASYFGVSIDYLLGYVPNTDIIDNADNGFTSEDFIFGRVSKKGVNRAFTRKVYNIDEQLFDSIDLLNNASKKELKRFVELLRVNELYKRDMIDKNDTSNKNGTSDFDLSHKKKL